MFLALITARQGGQLLLSCEVLASSTACRFSPALSVPRPDAQSFSMTRTTCRARAGLEIVLDVARQSWTLLWHRPIFFARTNAESARRGLFGVGHIRPNHANPVVGEAGVGTGDFILGHVAGGAVLGALRAGSAGMVAAGGRTL